MNLELSKDFREQHQAFEAEMKATASRHGYATFGMSPDYAYGLPGCNAEVERAFVLARKTFPIGDLSHRFERFEDRIRHVVTGKR